MPPAAQPRPRFSVLVANRNYAALVTRAVDSVLQQDYPAELREVIVTDDGSTDDSLQQLARYAGTPGVTVVAQENRGQTGAYARALEQATGDFVCLLDSDDTCLPHKLRSLADHIQAIGGSSENLFLCHDLLIGDGADGEDIEQTWFNVVNVSPLGAHLQVSTARNQFPFSVTSGMVFGRALLQRLLDQVPQWEWPMGIDGVLGPAALIVTGEVHYVQQPLGRYVVHKNNNLASIVDGRFVAKPVWQQRWPKNLRFQELLVDSLALPDRERAERLAYLGRVEHFSRTLRPSPQHAKPLLSWVIDTTQAGPAQWAPWVAATAQALQRQVDPHFEAIWLCTEAQAALLPAGAPHRAVPLPADAARFERMKRGAAAVRGGYVSFIDAGDLPDPRFITSHLNAQRFGILPMLTVSDLRLLDASGAVVHTAVLGSAVQWGQGSSVIAGLGAPLSEWSMAPLPAVVFRRTPFFDAFFRADALPVHEAQVGWLLCQYLLQLGGGTRLAENLVDLRLPASATPNANWVSNFIDRHGPMPAPDLALCAEEIFAAYTRAADEERAYMSPAWEGRFMRWLAGSAGPAGAARLVQRARLIGGDELAAHVATVIKTTVTR
jgi:Glycosyl transferase family 2